MVPQYASHHGISGIKSLNNASVIFTHWVGIEIVEKSIIFSYDRTLYVEGSFPVIFTKLSTKILLNKTMKTWKENQKQNIYLKINICPRWFCSQNEQKAIVQKQVYLGRNASDFTIGFKCKLITRRSNVAHEMSLSTVLCSPDKRLGFFLYLSVLYALPFRLYSFLLHKTWGYVWTSKRITKF